MANYVPLISVLIALAGVIVSVYYSNQNAKNRDVDAVKKEVARDTDYAGDDSDRQNDRKAGEQTRRDEAGQRSDVA